MDAKVAELVEAFLREADRHLPAGYQAVLYGSAARGEWLTGQSDINLLIIADSLGPEALRRIGPALRALPEEWRSHPLLLEAEEWRRASDVFPVELTDMLHGRRVLRGADPVLGVQPHPTHLRAAVERELRTKIVRLRQGYALAADDPAALAQLARRTMATVHTLARATLVLLGRPVPGQAGQAMRAFAEVTGARAGPLVDVASRWRDDAWQCPPALFESYLESLSSAVEYIDHHVPGAR